MARMSRIFLMSSFALVGFVSAMDPVRKSVQKPLKEKRHLELESSQIEYYVGADLNYHKEYRSQQVAKTLVSFPLECTDPLPVEYCGDIRFFVSSAVEGSFGRPGEAHVILDPSITQMAVVRGVARSSNRAFQVYVGFNFGEFKATGYKGCNKIHSARALMITTKERSGDHLGYSWNHQHYVNVADAKYLSNQDIALEVRKSLLQNGIQDLPGWNSPLFQAKAKELFGERAQCFCLTGQCFSSPVCYWTRDENKLKGITYNSTQPR